MRVAAAGQGLIYTSASFSGQSDFVSQKSCICVNTVVTKSACPTSVEKRLSASICLCRRCCNQPLSSVNRKQRYNTLDFASKIVCQQGCFSPLLETQSQRDASCLLARSVLLHRRSAPLWTPAIFLARRYPNCKNAVCNRCKENTKGSICAVIVGAQIFLLTLTI